MDEPKVDYDGYLDCYTLVIGDDVIFLTSYTMVAAVEEAKQLLEEMNNA